MCPCICVRTVQQHHNHRRGNADKEAGKQSSSVFLTQQCLLILNRHKNLSVNNRKAQAYQFMNAHMKR